MSPFLVLCIVASVACALTPSAAYSAPKQTHNRRTRRSLDSRHFVEPRGRRLLMSMKEDERKTEFAEVGDSNDDDDDSSAEQQQQQQKRGRDDGSSFSFDSSGSSSKGLVSSLTGIVNFFMDAGKATEPGEERPDGREPPKMNDGAPSTPAELMERIREDYDVRNYLWTGDIDLSAFDKNCRFTDPTISFEGTDTFVSNVKNLVPIVDRLVGTGAGGGSCRSDLLQIECDEARGYVQTRWNMVGELNALPWKPKIDVIGRTKFWYRGTGRDGDDCQDSVRVHFYDEEWELPAGRALLQLVTPAGTIPNSALEQK